MSAYFCVRKGEQELVSFGRSSYVYQAFQPPYSEEWKELEQEDFLEAINAIRLQKTDYEEGNHYIQRVHAQTQVTISTTASGQIQRSIITSTTDRATP